jgi:hypothetical protein
LFERAPEAIVVPVESRRVSGNTVSMMSATDPVVELPAGSVVVMTGLDPISSPVPVQVTVPPVDGDGTQVVLGIDTVSPAGMVPVVMVTLHPLDGFGEAVAVGIVGGVVST